MFVCNVFRYDSWKNFIQKDSIHSMNPFTGIQMITMHDAKNEQLLADSWIVFLEIVLEKAPAFILQVLINYALDTWGYAKVIKATMSFVSLVKGILKFMSLRKAAATHEVRKRVLASTKVWCLDKNGW